MKLTKEQVLSFIQDDTTVANTDGMDLVEDNIELSHSDEGVYILVIKFKEKFYMGRVNIYCQDEWELYDDKGMELTEVVQVTKSVKSWVQVP